MGAVAAVGAVRIVFGVEGRGVPGLPWVPKQARRGGSELDARISPKRAVRRVPALATRMPSRPERGLLDRRPARACGDAFAPGDGAIARGFDLDHGIGGIAAIVDDRRGI